ncbi:GNAT family N-acetyltransferase [Paenibacillus sp. N1-5-1-14]|uniref:GNAT family N-acetyltransferase n=1 Tax=Paenibacillus radicibacter TaxID=2972488 RepID=UPI0021598782|nr:GNAT family N-acetyltransferase [Paenibacillus radicibacter]MCR8643086.1 GNAT family N-acetyltransferase [Paenibacillus radicibacter]
MLIRDFKLSDYGLISALLEDTLSEECFVETMQALGRQLSWDSELILVAELNGEVVGMIIGTIDNNKGYFYRIAVIKEHQGKGIGMSMVNALKQRFELRQVQKVMISIDRHNEIAIPTYLSAGYQESDFARSPERLSIVKNVM